jgi:hypothetical protein
MNMGYEDARRHLEPVRDHFEKNKILRISTSYVSTRKGEPSAIISLDTEFVGAYLLNDKLVVMMKFDDLKVDSLHVDIAYDAIRERTKKVLHNTFPGLEETDLAIHVVDCSGSLADMEFV